MKIKRFLPPPDSHKRKFRQRKVTEHESLGWNLKTSKISKSKHDYTYTNCIVMTIITISGIKTKDKIKTHNKNIKEIRKRLIEG